MHESVNPGIPQGTEPSDALANHPSLDPRDWPAFRAQAHQMLDDMLGSIEGIRKQPVWQTIPDEVRLRFRAPLPSTPTELSQVHEDFMQSILPYTARNGHPGFMGWMQGGGTPVGMLAEMLAAGLNANVGGRDQVPLEVERQIVDWMRTLFGFPQQATGLLVTGTSMANFIAMKVARDARLGMEVRRQGIAQSTQKLVAYAASSVHSCVLRALDMAGLGSDCLRLVPVDDRNRMDLAALARMVAADRAAAFTPFFVVGTAGTVDTGSIDDLAGIAKFCAEQQLWFHVDGACAALGILAPNVAPRLKGIERADSLAFDFHKWGQVPYDAGFILIRDGAQQQESFAAPAAYLSRGDRGMSAGSPWPCDLGPDLSRGFRALKVWATLKTYGTEAIGKVIGHTCELARDLEARIGATPELELLAPVELNIVCFRYRFDGLDDEANNERNNQLVIALQEAGAVAPSTTKIGDRLAIRAAIVNHRTTRAEIDTLVKAVLAAGRSLLPVTSAPPAVESDQRRWEPWFHRTAQLEKIEAQLSKKELLAKDTEVTLRYQRAMLLTQLGRTLEARSEHLKVVEIDPTHLRNLNAFGLLLAVTGNRKAALIVLSEAVKLQPDSIVSRVNYGGVLLEENDAATAREQFEAALRIDPKFPQGHAGLSYALTKLGDPEAAERHRRLGFGQKNFFTNLYRGNAQPVPVLLLVASTGGNTPVERLIDDTVFQMYVVVADFYDRTQPLPAHQLVVNGIGDADVSQQALLAAETLLAYTSAPVLNAPSAVSVTGRCNNAARLRDLDGVISPVTRLFPHSVLAGPKGIDALLQQGFRFPVLLRAPGFHMGQHFVQVETRQDLATAVADMPGTGRADAQVLAIEHLDARGADGFSRKYRVMLVDGEIYPLHLAISPQWKIHYFSSDMAHRPDHRAEETLFLANMPRVLGQRAMDALRHIQKALALDYAGIDFGLGPDGEVLLFEANATMVVPRPDEGEIWDYRRSAVDRIHAAVHRMLLRTAGVPMQREPEPAFVPVSVTLSRR